MKKPYKSPCADIKNDVADASIALLTKHVLNVDDQIVRQAKALQLGRALINVGTRITRISLDNNLADTLISCFNYMSYEIQGKNDYEEYATRVEDLLVSTEDSKANNIICTRGGSNKAEPLADQSSDLPLRTTKNIVRFFDKAADLTDNAFNSSFAIKLKATNGQTLVVGSKVCITYNRFGPSNKTAKERTVRSGMIWGETPNVLQIHWFANKNRTSIKKSKIITIDLLQPKEFAQAEAEATEKTEEPVKLKVEWDRFLSAKHGKKLYVGSKVGLHFLDHVSTVHGRLIEETKYGIMMDESKHGFKIHFIGDKTTTLVNKSEIQYLLLVTDEAFEEAKRKVAERSQAEASDKTEEPVKSKPAVSNPHTHRKLSLRESGKKFEVGDFFTLEDFLKRTPAERFWFIKKWPKHEVVKRFFRHKAYKDNLCSMGSLQDMIDVIIEQINYHSTKLHSMAIDHPESSIHRVLEDRLGVLEDRLGNALRFNQQQLDKIKYPPIKKAK